MPHGSVCFAIDCGQILVEIGAVCQQCVEVRTPDDGPQGGLGDLGGGDREVLHGHNRFRWIGHPEQHDGVDAGGHVVAGDDLLRRDGQRDRTQLDAHELVDAGHDDDDARPEGSAQPAEAECNAALVLLDDAQRTDRQRHKQDD